MVFEIVMFLDQYFIFFFFGFCNVLVLAWVFRSVKTLFLVSANKAVITRDKIFINRFINSNFIILYLL
jgi:hypothetical protein